jgi:hypothetical protein
VNDHDLRQTFERLRAEEGERIPPFRVQKRPQRRTAWALAAAALLILLVVTIRPRKAQFSNDDRAAAQALAEWQPPTEFLLATPGSELLSTTPRIPDLKGIAR